MLIFKLFDCYILQDYEKHFTSIKNTVESNVYVGLILTFSILLIFFRLKLSLYCPMNLRKFPMDEQVCEMIFESCEYGLERSKLHAAM